MPAGRPDAERTSAGSRPAVTGTLELPILAKRPDRVVAILDDDAATCQMLARIIERLGMKPAATTDPAHLFDMLSGDPYAVLLDLSMPGKNGLDVIRMLAERRVKSRIVLISGHDDVVLGAARELGARRGLDMAGALRKPIPVGELRRLLDTADETGATSCTRLVPLIDPERLSADDVLRMLRAHFQP